MFHKLLNDLQRLGKALMVPIAVLPAAAIFLRLGSGDLLNIKFVEAAGSAVFGNLPALFAIGIAFGLAADKHGAAALSGAVSYFIITETALAINEGNSLGHLAGIIAGCIGGYCYNHFRKVKLPDWLGFFGGRRFVPIVAGGMSIITGFVLGQIYPVIENALSNFSSFIENAPAGVGEFMFGLLNRALLPFGLHHILNTYVNNFLGEWNGITGEVNRFFAQNPALGLVDPSAGRFGCGGFAIDMFALPAVALAMYTCVKKENRHSVSGAYFSVALTAMVTGITEPIEFMFMFIAPGLYVFHAVMFGVSCGAASILGIRHKDTFSSGLIDYVMNYNLSTKAWLLIPLGLVIGVIYFLVFRWAIKKFDLPVPGRDDSEGIGIADAIRQKGLDRVAKEFLEKLGGRDNIIFMEPCITRLRMQIKNPTLVDDDGLKAAGASGVMRMGKDAIQVVVGPQAETLADEINKYIGK